MISSCHASERTSANRSKWLSSRRGAVHAMRLVMTTDPGLRDPHTFSIIGAAMEVHTELAVRAAV